MTVFLLSIYGPVLVFAVAFDLFTLWVVHRARKIILFSALQHKRFVTMAGASTTPSSASTMEV